MPGFRGSQNCPRAAPFLNSPITFISPQLSWIRFILRLSVFASFYPKRHPPGHRSLIGRMALSLNGGVSKRWDLVTATAKSLFENSKGSCCRGKGQRARRDEAASPVGAVTEEQRSPLALSSITLRVAVLFGVACVGSAGTAHLGDAPTSPQDPFQFSNRL